MIGFAIKENIKLSTPIICNSLLGIASSILVMYLMARLGVEALAAGSLIASTYGVLIMLTLSFSFPVGILVAKNVGRKKLSEVGCVVRQALLLITVLSIPLFFVFIHIDKILIYFNQPKNVAQLVKSYFHYFLWGYLPSVWLSVIMQFFVGINKPRITLFFSTVALFLTIPFSILFIFGYHGISPMGVAGAGLAMSLIAIIIFLMMLCYLFFNKNIKIYSLFDPKNKGSHRDFFEIFKLGFPISIQYGGELSAIAFITYFMGIFGVYALAAQQVILQYTSIVIMVPMGVSQALSILVSRSVGAREFEKITIQKNAALIIGYSFSLIVALIYWIFPRSLSSLYLNMNHVSSAYTMKLSITLLAIAGWSQLFDAGRNILTGVFRGLHDAKVPMVIGMVSCWLVGIPCAYLIGFLWGYGPIGVRVGFMIGIIVGFCLLLMRWEGRVKQNYI